MADPIIATLSSPENSFIQFRSVDDQAELYTCSDVFNTCLPVNRNTDLSFQLFWDLGVYEEDTNDDYTVGLIRDCDDTEALTIPETYGTDFATIDWRVVDDDGRSVGLSEAIGDYDLDSVFNDGDCFRLGIFQNIVTNNYSLSQTPNGVYGVFLVIDGVDTEISNGAVLPNMAALLTLVNNYFLGAGITDVATSPVSPVLIIISNSGIVYGNFTFLTGITSVHSPVVVPHLRYCSNCLKYTIDICWTSLIKYRSNENSFGFDYSDTSFYNIIRLPFYLNNPQPITTENVFRLSTGGYKMLSAVFEKEHEARVGYLDEEQHFRLAIALKHDVVRIKDQLQTSFRRFFMEAKYEIDWLNKPGTNINVAPSKVLKLKESPYYNVNSNCDETVGLIDQ